MFKKFIAIMLCLNLVCPTVFAEGTFSDDSDVEVGKTASESELETKEIAVPEESKDEKKEESKEEAKQVDYTVVSGDYLSAIAERYLGDSSRWPEIVQLNKDKYPSLSSWPEIVELNKDK